MRANRRRDTVPELRLRAALYRRGWRFRVDMPIRFCQNSGLDPECGPRRAPYLLHFESARRRWEGLERAPFEPRALSSDRTGSCPALYSAAQGQRGEESAAGPEVLTEPE